MAVDESCLLHHWFGILNGDSLNCEDDRIKNVLWTSLPTEMGVIVMPESVTVWLWNNLLEQISLLQLTLKLVVACCWSKENVSFYGRLTWCGSIYAAGLEATTRISLHVNGNSTKMTFHFVCAIRLLGFLQSEVSYRNREQTACSVIASAELHPRFWCCENVACRGIFPVLPSSSSEWYSLAWDSVGSPWVRLQVIHCVVTSLETLGYR